MQSNPPGPEGTRPGSDDPRQEQEAPEQDGQVSEVAGLHTSGEEPPGDATAGYPDVESGGAQEGTAGPNAPPRHQPPEPSNESSR